VSFGITLEITDTTQSPYINGAEISAFADANGDPATDVDSTPDAVNDDPVIDDPANADGNVHQPTPGDEDDHDVEVVIIPAYDLALAKTFASPASAIAPGGLVTFNIEITNQGVPVESVEITDYVQPGFTYVQANQAGGTVDSGDGELLTYAWGATPVATVTGAKLDTGESFIVPIVLEIDAGWAGEPLENWAEISNFDNDQDPANGDAASGSIIDVDSTPDAIDGSDGSQGPGESMAGDHVDDAITGDGTAGGDEDDHDVASLFWHDLTLIKERDPAQSYEIDLSGTPPTVSYVITVKNQGLGDVTSCHCG